MLLYGYVENGQIKDGPTPLPKTWQNFSSFDLMTPTKYPLLGWFPWVKQETPGEVLDYTTIEVKDNQIIQTNYNRAKTQSEKDAELLEKTEQQKARRLRDYRIESDPLFFKWQRGEVTKEEWLAMVDEIKQRYPYPTAQ